MSIIRDITLRAKKYLKSDEILLFIGARQAGKTTILKQIKKYLEKNNETAVYYLNLEDYEYLDLLNKTPKNIFKIFPIDKNKKNYIFIDEVQYLKNPSNFLKYLFDEYQGIVKLIVSGSSAFYLDKKFKDSLAGRKKIFYVSTLSFLEFLRFKNENNLSKKDLKKLSLTEKEKISIYYREFMIFGGYPRVVLASQENKGEILREIAFSYIKKDIYEAGIKQEEIFYKLFRILSSQIGGLFNALELSNTLGASKTAIDNYLYVMRKSFHIAFLTPFFKNTRKELTKMPKIYFYDLGLRNFFANNLKQFEERDDKGALLENAVFRQFRDFFEKDQLRFWRTTQKNEIDFILNEKDAFEVKVNANNFKKSKYKKFFELYPDIDLSIISIDKKENRHCGCKVFDVWEI
ncbi:ATP-binding protein [Candidatus Parcubacteria bacterium]|nr:ATP-binding protein [Candidatus Parcubacteria bacterium]